MELMTVKNAAEILKMSKVTIYNLIKSNKISYKTNNLNNIKYVDINEIMKLMEIA